MNDRVLVTNIQRFSLHDGPGIRTTVFLKGCGLHCPWCSNPENISNVPEEHFVDGKKGVYGTWYSCEDLLSECIKDKTFYSESCGQGIQYDKNGKVILDSMPGGVTFSGGEPLLQIDKMQPIIKTLKENQISVVVESSLYVPQQLMQASLEWIDLFYADIKILDKKKAQSVEGGDLEMFLSNFEMLCKSNRPVVARIPVIGGHTDGEDNIEKVKTLLSNYSDAIVKVELIKEHKLAEKKYRSLGKEIDYCGVSEALMESYRVEILRLGIETEICSF